MTKEKIKTLLLTLLVLSSITFSGQIWFDKKLWPNGYDFFSVYQGTFLEKIGRLFYQNPDPLNINVTGALDSVFSPRTIMLSYIDGRLTYNVTQNEGKEITDVFNTVIKEALSLQSATTISETEWQSQLKAKGIYADYSVPISFAAFGKFLGLNDVSITGMTTFYQIVIVPDEFSVSTVPVYFRDRSTQKQIKINAKFDKSIISSVLSKHENNQKLNLSYSFELNLDKKVEGEGMEHQKIIFDSYILLPLDPLKMNVIEKKDVDITNNTDNILKAFDYNPNIVKKFTETNDSILFVDSNSTLKIRKDGYIEYKAADNTKGIKTGNDKDITTAVVASARLIDNLLSQFNINPNTKLFINSPLSGNSENDNYTFYFDYLYNSHPITTNEHGCVIEVTNGNITSLKAYLKSYEEVSEGTEKNPLEVIDNLYTTLSGEYSEVKVNELYPGYEESQGQVPLKWQAKVENVDKIVSIY